ncbi:small, acid-soluble spore protein, alpha/beta type [Moorella sp. Hama-1]|uniref:small, acid-soluble spore protein, alpha/beta type n=1 Tax=Moorella sp. Hama-1 TaxID=2138101 RepID=UPI00137A9785|nr:small, acid-soluble spore protein, alpha/beta type [Moorella sp. Hama-1]MDN5361950.1 small acid-soluble spore protein [Moorella sp. (in: firmicutes)]BCV20843.1 spore protein [Moorella sp. Hama-1]
MARRRGIMSDALKWELAKELGVADTVATEGWGGVPSRQCGNLVRLAIEKAEQSLVNNHL